MREFSWRYFTLTGDIEAYLLYRKHAQVQPQSVADQEEEEAEEASTPFTN